MTKVSCMPAFLDQVQQFLPLLQIPELKIVMFNALYLERYDKPWEEPRNSERKKFSFLT